MRQVKSSEIIKILEYEKKILLNREEYEALYESLCFDKKPILQTNYYFDCESLSMNKKGITCRVRKKGDKYYTVIKRHSSTNNGCSKEDIIDVQKRFDPEAFKCLGLSFKGCLITERYTVLEDTFCKVVVDRNIYLGKTDFELEVEYFKGCETEAYQIINRIAEKLGSLNKIYSPYEFMHREGKSKSKSERFFERYSEVNKNEFNT